VKRINISSGTVWENLVGYSRAVIHGNYISISGTTAFDDNGQIVGIKDPYTQTKQIIANIEKVLIQAGSDLTKVYRTRMYVTDISQWEEIGKAHLKYFKNIKPSTSMIEVSKLISDEMLIEIEAEAYLDISS